MLRLLDTCSAGTLLLLLLQVCWACCCCCCLLHPMALWQQALL
jgi:hypothetical protein